MKDRDDDATFLRRMLVAIALVALALAIWRLADLLLLIFGAVLLAVVLRSIAAPIRRRAHLPEVVALGIAVLSLLAVLAIPLGLFGAEVVAQARALSDLLPAAWQTIEQRIGNSLFGEQLREWLQGATPGGSQMLAGARAFASGVTGLLAGLVLVFVGAIYLAARPELYRSGLLKLLPKSRRALGAQALEETERALRRWLLGQLIAMSIVGVLTGVGLALIGIPSALALGLLAGLADFVPLVGPIVAAIPALLIALTQGNEVALWTMLLYLAVQQIEGNVVAPLVQQKVVDLPAALTLFAIVAAGTLFGAVGVLLAAPLTVVVFVLVKRLYVREALDTPTPVPGESTSRS